MVSGRILFTLFVFSCFLFVVHEQLVRGKTLQSEPLSQQAVVPDVRLRQLQLDLQACQSKPPALPATENVNQQAREASLDNQWYSLIRRSLLQGCNDVCDFSDDGHPSLFMNFVKKNINCRAMFANPLFDTPAERWPPPREVPPVFAQDFSMGGKLPISSVYFAQRYAGSDALESQWTQSLIDDWIKAVRNGTLHGSYGVSDTNALYKACLSLKEKDSSFSAEGRHFLVVGSERPWVEAVLLACGASKVTTLEYGKIVSTHPQVTSMTPPELAQRLLNGERIEFTGAASFSSVEHSGLGRYGDLLNPWGDFIAMARLWCVVSPNSPLLFATMTSADERIEWNAHRFYSPSGASRYSKMMANWNQVSGPRRFVGGSGQDVLVFSRAE